jgi:hypothetical protein
MSQDPYSRDNPDPEKPYDVPSSYEMPSQPPYGAPPPQTPYGVPPSHSYQVPPQTSYGEPQQIPYGVPPLDAYGAQGYDPNQFGYGYAASGPLPLNEAIAQLPNQYVKVLTKPSAFTFAAEMGKASWDIVWVQLIGYAVVAGILTYLRTLIPGAALAYGNPNSMPAATYGVLQVIALFTSAGSIILIPISFFIGQGIIYLVAKAFGGTGTFLAQAYTYLLIIVPLGIISLALGLIPFLGAVAGFGLGIYGLVLQIFSLMPVHRLSGGKATAVVLIPIAAVFVLLIVLVIILVVLIASSIHNTPYPSY